MGFWEFLFGVVLIGVIGFAAFVGLIVYGVRRGVRSLKGGGNSFEAPDYHYLDEGKGAPAEDITGILKHYAHADGVDARVKTALNQVESATRKRDSLHALIEGIFTPNSITWSKFISAVDTAYQVLIQNLTQLTNRVQTFDVQDYRTQRRSRSSAAFKRDGIPDDVQEQRWVAMQDSLVRMDEILTANEHLLLDLDKFALELGQLDQAGSSDDRTEEMLEEIRSLTEELKFYRQN